MPPAFRLPGLTAAPYTPFTASGDLNLDVIPTYAARLAADGVTGAFVCGTTGEGASLTIAERKAVAAAWASAAPGRLKVVVNVAHASGREAAGLAAHAAQIGADAVACTAPYYFRPAGVAELVRHLTDVAAAAPGVPFYYYDIPSATGVVLPTADVLTRAAERIPLLAGVKFSNPDLLTLQECVAAAGGRFDVLFGIDEYLLAALALGAGGAVGSTYNFAAPAFLQMLASFEAGNMAEARKWQAKCAGLIRVLIEFGGIRAGKAVMWKRGIDCGPVRSPLRPMGDEEAGALMVRIGETGIV